tara:strand:- start:209 stop:784 length:576 start_codon:yes stop_codon:yes gene_type:complete
MINSELGHVKTLEEFHSSIREQQEEAHGEYYCAIHDAIQRNLKDCNSYMELGVHQGGTAAAAMLCNPKQICLIDMDMSRYKRFLMPIAEEYCTKNNIKLDLRQVDSTGFGSINPTDMLVIDSYHHPNHMTKELEVHGKNVSKYIIAHDTSIINGRPNDALFHVLAKFADENKWEIVEREHRNVGYTVLKKS